VKVAVIRFPGSNCDQDAFFSLREDIGVDAAYVWHEETSLAGYDAVVLPGGFSYGDYLRCGAMAARSSIIHEIQRFAEQGKPVIGVCNGFQILCEAGILPGALLLNEGQKFICRDVYLEAVNKTSLWTRGVTKTLRIPIAHGEGRYCALVDEIKRLEDEDRVAFRYVAGPSQSENLANPNGSLDSIAGVLNQKGNVLGMMPHPERATSALLGYGDGKEILNALTLVLR
jgi:phosphoribosylformylglycinamidine synthase subunit PurQ / glutaminase